MVFWNSVSGLHSYNICFHVSAVTVQQRLIFTISQLGIFFKTEIASCSQTFIHTTERREHLYTNGSVRYINFYCFIV